jgi:diacylglycerol kinase family enzyme
VSLVAFVLNGTLLRDPRRFARHCRAAAEARGWKSWFGPAPDRAGPDKASSAAAEIPALIQQAVVAGAALVVAAGGDGTVRACAEGLAGTGVPLAVVPLGTANLIARALGVPGRAERALEVAFGGRDQVIDLGRVTDAAGTGTRTGTGGGGTGGDGTRGDGTRGDGFAFAAMAGIGLDAAVVGAARPYVKRRLGWVAYALAGAPRLGWPASDFTIGIDGAAPLRRRARCVVVANAGLLPGGFTLLPAARLDDGLLDVGVLAPGGGWDWLRLGGQVLGRRVAGGRVAGGRVAGGQVASGQVAGGSGRGGELEGGPGWLVEGGRGRLVEVSADRVLPRQADGEILAPDRTLSVSVSPGALVLRLPS